MLDRVPNVKVFGVVQQLLVLEHADRAADPKGDPIKDRAKVIRVVRKQANVVLAAACEKEGAVEVAEELRLEPDAVRHRVVLAQPLEHERCYWGRFHRSAHGARYGAEMHRDVHVRSEGGNLIVFREDLVAGGAYAVRAPSKLARGEHVVKTNGAFFLHE